MRSHLWALLALFASGCVSSDYGDAMGFEVILVDAEDVDELVYTAYCDSSCDSQNQFAVGGEAASQLDHFPLNRGESSQFSLPVGTYHFEIIALDVAGDQLAAGCAVGTVRSDDSATVRITLVDITN